ncbi:MAG: 30S ribosomal protein S7 [Bacillota bacterium]|nr:30S ribosomal protein S7 [Bacillota bacterium]
MPRRGRVPRRSMAGDPMYGSEMVARLINNMMWDGKKSVAENIVYRAFDIVGKKSGRDPLEVFEQALKNAMPSLEVRPRRVGGATYQVPIEVRPERRVSLGMRWLVQFARGRNERTMIERLAGEILDASAGQGGTVKKKEDTHRMAEANRAFAHYRW